MPLFTELPRINALGSSVNRGNGRPLALGASSSGSFGLPQVCPKYQGVLEGDNVKGESVKTFRVSKVDVALT